MRPNSKGRKTLPAFLRERHDPYESDQAKTAGEGSAPRTVREGVRTPGQRLVRGMRDRATTPMSTDQLLELLRGE